MMLLWIAELFLIGSSSAFLPDYCNASYFWPLDKLPVHEVVTKEEAKVSNSSLIIYTGQNVGHFTYSAPVTIVLGTYRSSCLINLKKCVYGFTVGFWFQLVNCESYNGKFNLFTFSGDFINPIQTWVTLNNGQPVFNAALHIITLKKAVTLLKRIESEAGLINFGKWYFVVLMYNSVNDKMVAYLNNEQLKSSITYQTFNDFNSSNTYVDLILGHIPLKTPLEHQNITISIKNVLLWEKLLTNQELNFIYLREIETVTLLPNCITEDGDVVIKWIVSDPNHFQHIKSYNLEWWIEGQETSEANTAIIPASSMNYSSGFKIEAFEPNSNYQMLLKAHTIGSHPLSDFIQNCATKENGGKVHLSVVGTTATVIWDTSIPDKLFLFDVNLYLIANSSIQARYTTNANYLNYTIFKLNPNSFYQFEIEKIDQQTGVKILYKKVAATESEKDPCLNKVCNEDSTNAELNAMFLKRVGEEGNLNHARMLLNEFEKLIKIEVQLINQLNLSSKVKELGKIVFKLQKLNLDQNNLMLRESFVEIPDKLLQTGNQPNVLVVGCLDEIIKMIGIPNGTRLQKSSENFTLNSELLTVSLYPKQSEPFERPVVIVQKLDMFSDMTPNCVYLKDTNDSVYWTDEGCLLHKSNSTHVVCHCYHLTNFAVLMSVTNTMAFLSKTNAVIMNIITVIGIAISLVFLLLSFLTFLFVRSIQSIRTTIHKNLAIALFVSQFIFLFIDKTENKAVCQTIAALLHYFFLVSFLMMGFEGIVLYLMLVKVFRVLDNSISKCIKYIGLCWVLPVMFIILNMAIDSNAYGNHLNYCWLSVKSGFIWSFVGPVIFIISINFYILVRALIVVSTKAKKRSSNVALLWFWIRSTSLVLCILGITWAVGIFYVDSDSLFFGYIFTIVNSLQGFAIFVFHCALDSNVRSAWRNSLWGKRSNTFFSWNIPSSVSPTTIFSFYLRSKQVSSKC